MSCSVNDVASADLWSTIHGSWFAALIACVRVFVLVCENVIRENIESVARNCFVWADDARWAYIYSYVGGRGTNAQEKLPCHSCMKDILDEVRMLEFSDMNRPGSSRTHLGHEVGKCDTRIVQVRC